MFQVYLNCGELSGEIKWNHLSAVVTRVQSVSSLGALAENLSSLSLADDWFIWQNSCCMVMKRITNVLLAF